MQACWYKNTTKVEYKKKGERNRALCVDGLSPLHNDNKQHPMGHRILTYKEKEWKREKKKKTLLISTSRIFWLKEHTSKQADTRRRREKNAAKNYQMTYENLLCFLSIFLFSYFYLFMRSQLRSCFVLFCFCHEIFWTKKYPKTTHRWIFALVAK